MASEITTLVPWFGTNRTGAENVGAVLAHCRWVGVPFAGGMCELRHIKAASIIVGDVHRHEINLANHVKSDQHRQMMIDFLDRTPVHPDALEQAQAYCKQIETGEPIGVDPYTWACNYFVAAWQCRNGDAGTKREFESGFSVRWKDGGGDSAMRFRNATEALKVWGMVFRRCTFVVEDCFQFLDRCHDLPKHGVYCDPPFPDVGEKYKFAFTEDDHRKLAAKLATFKQSTIVCRFYDHPLVRELYPASEWKWFLSKGRKQSNEAGDEVLLINRSHA